MFWAIGSITVPFRIRATIAAAFFGLTLALTHASFANPPGITNIDPFFGEYFETFNEFFLSSATQYSIFSGVGDLRADNGSSAILITTSSSFGNDEVDARSGKMAGQFTIADWDFTQPVAQFGGYWENNSSVSDATVEFFDSNNQSLGTVVASVPVSGQKWVWNGWNFDTPISRIRVVGNGFDNGLIWYDDMEMTTVPEPAGCALFALCGVILSRRRRGKLC